MSYKRGKEVGVGHYEFNILIHNFFLYRMGSGDFLPLVEEQAAGQSRIPTGLLSSHLWIRSADYFSWQYYAELV